MSAVPRFVPASPRPPSRVARCTRSSCATERARWSGRSCLRIETVEVDQVNHLACIALDSVVHGEPANGVARCIRLSAEPYTAEVAISVLDSCQGCGLGTLLLGVLCKAAADQGIRTFRAYVHGDNNAMLRIFRDLGASIVSLESAAYQVDIPVPKDPSLWPDTPAGTVFKAVVGQGCAQAA
jgi:GNAT superfamily N-acetyltransferase